MWDYILGSEEFLIRYYDLLEVELLSCLPKTPVPASTPPRLTPSPYASDETPSPAIHHNTNTTNTVRSTQNPHIQSDPYLDEIEEDADASRNPRDTGLTAHNPTTGRTDLHFLNSLIKKVGALHNEIDKSTRLKKEQSLINKSKRQYHLHKEINKNTTPQAVNEQHQEEYNNLQREIRMESEIKEKAKKLRIQNFYKSKNGKLNSTSFYSVKEKQPSRTIKEIWHNGQSVEGWRVAPRVYGWRQARYMCNTLARCGPVKRLENSVKIQPYNSRPALCPQSLGFKTWS